MPYLHGGTWHYRPNRGHRSGLEDAIADEIKAAEDVVSYEEHRLTYTVPEEPHTYTPDFVLKNGIIIEAKGLFEASDRKKHLLIQKEHPSLDIRFVFSNPQTKLNKGSKTTYALWCEKHGFKYARKLIPMAWFLEPKRLTKGLERKVNPHVDPKETC